MEADVGLFTAMAMNVLSAAAIMAVGWFGGKWVGERVKSFDKLDATLRSFLGNLARYTILVLAAVSVLQKFGVETASLLALLGAAGLAIGLALQGTLSNVAAGVMMLMLRPFKVGDYVEAGSVGGTVKELGLLTTLMDTPDNVRITVPNSQIWSAEIRNYSFNAQRRIDVVCGISYDDDINKGMKTIQKVLDADKRLVTTKGKEPLVFVSGLGDSSVDLTGRVWCSAGDYWQVKWDLNKAVKEALDKDGLTIPFPTRTLEVVNLDVQEKAKAAPKKKAA